MTTFPTSNITVPVIGLSSPMNYVPKTTKIPTVPNTSTKKRSNGGIYAGEIYIEYQSCEILSWYDSLYPDNDGVGVTSKWNAIRHGIEINDDSLYAAILAIPMQYGFTDYPVSQKGQNTRTQVEQLRIKYSSQTAFLYVLMIGGDEKIKNTSLSGLVTVPSESRESSSTMNNAWLFADRPKFSQSTPYNEINRRKYSSNSSYYTFESLRTWMDTVNSGQYTNTVYDRRFSEISESYLNTLADSEIKDLVKLQMVSDSWPNLYSNYVVRGSHTHNRPYQLIASSMQTTLPIFNIANVDGIIEYFKTGNIEGADNVDDLVESTTKIPIDWTIYVHGNRNPDVYFTMKSNALDEFLSDPKRNIAGWTKNDFVCEYTVPEWKPSLSAVAGTYLWEYTGKYLDFYKNKYDNSFPTTWLDGCKAGSKEYIEERIRKWGEGASFYFLSRFRIKCSRNEKIYSALCESCLGYYGSPDMEEFNKLSNYGKVVSFDDGSTVTIIYDKLPPDYVNPDNPYKEPNINSDITNSETDPSSNLSGVGASLLTTCYKVTDGVLQELGHDLWSDNFFKNIFLLNNSPIENIVGVKVMPVNVSGVSEQIVIGNVKMDLSGEVITNTPVVDCGSFQFDGYYKSFLDFSPFTDAYLFLPFIGFVEIDTNQFTGHTLSVKYSFDIVMGQCRAMLFADGIYCESYDGICGVDIPLVASNRAQMDSASIASFIENPKDAVNIANLAGMTIAGLTADTSVGFRAFHSKRSGAYTSQLSWMETRNIYLVLLVPESNQPENYAHTVGLPCSVTYRLGNLSGFTAIAEGTDLSGIVCTEEERQELLNLLLSGVYL